MTWTSAFGRACGWLLDASCMGWLLPASRPTPLTFIGLVINIVAAFLFGHANAANGDIMFFYAGLVSLRARESSTWSTAAWRAALTRSPSSARSFDSVIDRYSDVVLFLRPSGLLRAHQSLTLRSAGGVRPWSLRSWCSYTRARAEALSSHCKWASWSGRSASCSSCWRAVQPLGSDGSSAVQTACSRISSLIFYLLFLHSSHQNTHT